MVGQDLYNIRVVDLFAGTGSLGLEALSRGAESAAFFDSSGEALKLINKNIERCGLRERSTIVRRDLCKGLPKEHPFFHKPVDLVFLDPPYQKGFIPFMLQVLSECNILASSALVVTEAARREETYPGTARLKLISSRNYGDTKIIIYSCEVNT
jgi:16S rRNA (guanine966-N2)-methyltransferase